MHNLLTALPSIANLKLNHDDSIAILQLIASTTHKTAEEFQKALDKKRNADLKKRLPKKSCLAILDYLDAWQKMIPIVMTWYSLFSLAWFRVTHRHLGADDLVPLISELLPDDLDELESIREKLDFASQIDQMNEAGCIIMQFYIAVYAKILFKKNPPTDSPQESSENITIVAKKIRDEAAYNALCFSCVKYHNHLCVSMTLQIDKLHYRGSRLLNAKEEKTSDMILTEVQNGLCGILIADKETLYLLQKYLLMCSIKKILFQSRLSTEECLVHFEKIYERYINILDESNEWTRKKWKLETGYAKLFDVGSTVTNQPIEAQFFKLSTAAESISMNDESEFTSLSLAVEAYQNHIECQIKSILEHVFYIKKGSLCTDNFFGEIMNDIQVGGEPMLIYNKDIISLFEKYLIVLDMQHSLFKKNIAEFSAKFTNHSSYLEKNLDFSAFKNNESIYSVNLYRFYALFPFVMNETAVLERELVERSDEALHPSQTLTHA